MNLQRWLSSDVIKFWPQGISKTFFGRLKTGRLSSRVCAMVNDAIYASGCQKNGFTETEQMWPLKGLDAIQHMGGWCSTMMLPGGFESKLGNWDSYGSWKMLTHNPHPIVLVVVQLWLLGSQHSWCLHPNVHFKIISRLRSHLFCKSTIYIYINYIIYMNDIIWFVKTMSTKEKQYIIIYIYTTGSSVWIASQSGPRSPCFSASACPWWRRISPPAGPPTNGPPSAARCWRLGQAFRPRWRNGRGGWWSAGSCRRSSG